LPASLTNSYYNVSRGGIVQVTNIIKIV
jgi:hypothetical protein